MEKYYKAKKTAPFRGLFLFMNSTQIIKMFRVYVYGIECERNVLSSVKFIEVKYVEFRKFHYNFELNIFSPLHE